MSTLAPRFLCSKRLYLRQLVESDVSEGYIDWLNDVEVCRGNSHHVFPYTRESALAYIRNAQQTRESLILAIVVNEGDKHVGNIALQHLHPYNRSAEFSLVVGDRAYWGNGYGTEAATLICSHGFKTLNLNRIYCGTFEHNAAMIKLASRLGMKEEGRRRQAAFKDGRFVDVIEFGVLAGEYAC